NGEKVTDVCRACAILRGDIDTPLLNKRPVPPSAEARARMMQPEDIADCVMLAVNLPERGVIEEPLIRPRQFIQGVGRHLPTLPACHPRLSVWHANEDSFDCLSRIGLR